MREGADRAVPNLPSRDFSVTEAFYGAFGFTPGFRDDGWMILSRGAVELEFFPYTDLDPWTSSFGCSIRVADLDELYTAIVAAGVPVRATGIPRIDPPRMQSWGLRAGHLIDPDGSILHLIGNAAN